MSQVMVIAPHPDDETLGCGGTLLKHRDMGDNIHWLIVTDMKEELGYTQEQIAKRKNEIQQVSELYGFQTVHKFSFAATQLDTIPVSMLVQKISDIFKKIQPNIVYVPYRGDVHSDHAVVFDAVISCTKWFRHPYIYRILAYETLSETEFGLNPEMKGFHPNLFVDISDYLESKISIMHVYQSEVSSFPFPRSVEAITALAKFRGSTSGFQAAEAFMILRERWA